MKVVRNNPRQLIIADIPWFLGMAIVAFILVFMGIGLHLLTSGDALGILFTLGGGGIGGLGFILFVRRVQIIFDRDDESLTIRRRSVFGYSEDRHPLADLDGAVIEVSPGSDSSNERPTLVLIRDGRKTLLPIVRSYTNTRGPALLVDAVNTWLSGGALDRNGPGA